MYLREDLRKELPVWLEEEKLDLVLSNDIDSLASCALLSKVKGWDIKYFYDFKSMSISKSIVDEVQVDKAYIQPRKCYIDVAVREGYAIDNHVSKLSGKDTWNPDMINLNNMNRISRINYKYKYAGSTLLEVWSILNYPLPDTEEGKMILLAVDSAFLGFYSNAFKHTQYEYLVDMMGFEELYEVIKRHTRSEFEDIIEKYRLKSCIKYRKETKTLHTELDLSVIGKLLGIELELPTDIFYVYKRFEEIMVPVSERHRSAADVNQNVFSLALTYKDSMKYSRIINRKEKKAA